MDADRFRHLTDKYGSLRIGILGDFCLDRYLEIDPARAETSIETGLPVYNVVNVRPQPGGAGTILNNLCSLDIGTVYPIGFAGEDGEGYELCRALEQMPGVDLAHFKRTHLRRTFTYCKPLIIASGKSPRELNRLDTKNWVATPSSLQDELRDHLLRLAQSLDALIILDQVDIPETGVVTTQVLGTVADLAVARPSLIMLADSRRGLDGFPSVIFKMNVAELAVLRGTNGPLTAEAVRTAALELALKNGRRVFVSLSEKGILGATPDGVCELVPALPVRGEIDIVGAGDAVSANLTAALAAGATLRESLEMANAAASVVVHKLGTTGTACQKEIAALLGF